MGTFFEDITWPSGLERSEEKSFPRISILKKEISRQARDDLPAQLKSLRSFIKLQDDKKIHSNGTLTSSSYERTTEKSSEDFGML